MSDIFGAVGQVASAAIQASAIKDATQMQVDALEKQRKFVFDQLDPNVIGPQATIGDIQRAQNRLALQGQIDPALLATRYAAEDKQAKFLSALGPGSTADTVAQKAASEALTGVPGMQEGKKQLVDQALHELSLGATLPPDIQAEIVKAGLERTGQTQGAAGPQGFGQPILRQLIGQAGLNLQTQRQQKAQQLMSTAQQLEQSRQSILGSLFPNLSSVQLNTMKGVQSALQLSDSLVPEAGLSGSNIANIWLARVGATNQLAQSAANAAAAGGVAQAQAWAPVAPAVGSALGQTGMFPTTKSLWNSAIGSGGGSEEDAMMAMGL